jgi:hypothetical protein
VNARQRGILLSSEAHCHGVVMALATHSIDAVLEIRVRRRCLSKLETRKMTSSILNLLLS